MSATDVAPPPAVHLDGAPSRPRPPAPVAAPRPRTQRMVLHSIEPWSVARLSAVFYACVCGVLLVAGVILWIGAAVTGVLGNVEGFFRDAGFEGFRFAPLQLLRAFTTIGVLLVAIGTAANVLLALLYNQLRTSVGGIRITVAEDVAPQTER